MPVHFDQFTSFIVNVDNSIMRAAAVFGIVDRVRDIQVAQAAERQRI